MYNAQYGKSSDQAMGYNNLLATHYATMHEYTLSAEICRTIHGLTIDRYGVDSSQARLTAERLVTNLEESSKDGTQPYSDSVYDDILQTYDVTDIRRIKASIAKAETYRSLEDPFSAETIYVNLWHEIAEACQRQKILENHEKLLEPGIVYAKFLCEYDRKSEAQTVLLGLWSQQQASEYTSEPTTAYLEEVANEMRHAGLQDMALDVLNTVLSCSETQDPGSARKAISDISLDLACDACSSPVLSKSSEVALSRILDASKSQGRSATDTSVVNALVNHFANANRFDDLIAVASEALHRLWPSIMDDSYSLITLDPFDPKLADLATRLVWGYTMSDQREKTGPMYWHLYQASKRSDGVDDSAVVEYANLALAAFEQTGQIDRTIALRQDLLDYCNAQYGEHHSITIECHYALASLYLQEQQFENAKLQYSKIASILKQPAFHEYAALPALRKLIDLHSREKSWDQALEAYGSLWNTFLARGTDYGFDSSASKEIYTGYTALLKKQDPVDTDAIHEATEGYRSACLAMYGERDPTTMESVLFLAESWNNRYPGCTKAIQLYECLVDGQDTLPDPREATKTTVEAAERRLTQFYQAGINGDMLEEAITRAVRLLEKRYQREKTSQGFSSSTTLSNLALWISMLTKEGSLASMAMAVRELQTAIRSVIRSDIQPSSLYNAAVVLANSFSANGFVEDGLDTVKKLTEQVIFEQYEIFDTEHARRSSLVFLTAFEAHLVGSTVGFAEIQSKVLKGCLLLESYKRLNHTDTELEVTLVCGGRLRKFLMVHEFSRTVDIIEGELYHRFMELYGVAFTQSVSTVRDFFLVLLNELSSERLQVDLSRLACVALNKKVGSLIEEGQVTAALDLSSPGFEFCRYVGAFAEDSNLESGIQLALSLAYTAPEPALLALSSSILREILALCRTRDFSFNKLDIDLISRVVAVLDLQQNFGDLEWLLTRLWLSRKNLTLSQDVVVSIGRRLVEVRANHGHIESATELGEDLLYNLQRVYGSAHPTTVDMASFLSSIYASTGDTTSAMAVIGDGNFPVKEQPTAKLNPPDTVRSKFLQFYPSKR